MKERTDTLTTMTETPKEESWDAVYDKILAKEEKSMSALFEEPSKTSLPDGNLPDGNLPDGNLPDGILPDGNLPDVALPEGIILLATSGKIGSGKDFIVANFIVPNLPPHTKYAVLSFSDSFKIDSVVKHGLTRQEVFEKKTEKSRKILQLTGTEQGRMVYGEDVWINWVKEQIYLYKSRGIECFIITDVRFPNEVDFIYGNNGYIFRIVAPERTAKKMKEEGLTTSHVSETALDNYKWDSKFIIENDPQYEKDVPYRIFSVLKLIFEYFAKTVLEVDILDLLTMSSIRETTKELSATGFWNKILVEEKEPMTKWLLIYPFLTDRERDVYFAILFAHLDLKVTELPHPVIITTKVLPQPFVYTLVYSRRYVSKS